MLRPEIIDAMSEEMGRVYEACVSRTLVNMARYFRYVPDGEQPLKTTYWQARKLAQLGQINRETLAIMGSLIGHMDKGITAALNKVINDSVRYVEPSLLAATKKGFLQPAAVPELTDSMAQVFELYYKQAADKTNLVNTVMLDSTRQAYMQAVSDVTAQTQLDERIRNTQTILNEAAGTVISGVDTFNRAQRAAVRSMVKNGLTGFVDHAGHKWRPETYVAMDIRTTLANTAREATMQRCEDYGSDLIQVSSHSGARPLCYPWQGKVLSTTDNARTVKDVDGNEIQVIGLHSTSYGQAAGLFGVNCGHFPTPFIPGFSALSDQSMIQPEKENEITYQQSQMQRALERKMRDAKTYLDVAKATNDPELIKEARGMVDRVDEALADFCDSTGRTRRKDREYLPVRATWPDVEPGRYVYNKDPYRGVFGVGGKAPQNVPSQETKTGAKVVESKVQETAVKVPTFETAATFDELETALRNEYKGVKLEASVRSLDIDLVKQALRGVKSVTDQYPDIGAELKNISTDNSGVMSCSGGTINFNPKFYAPNSTALADATARCTGSHWWVDNATTASIGAHETAHSIEWFLDTHNPAYQYAWDRVDAWNKCTEAKRIVSQACKNVKKTPAGKGKKNDALIEEISKYAKESASETLAEAFATVFANGDNAPALALEIVKLTREEYIRFGGKTNGN